MGAPALGLFGAGGWFERRLVQLPCLAIALIAALFLV
jgi:hypothetical protein